MRRVNLPDGGVKLWVSAKETYQWAHRSGSAWPCSTLSGKRVFAEFAGNGDLVDYAVNGKFSEEMDGTEFTALTDDFLNKRKGA